MRLRGAPGRDPRKRLARFVEHVERVFRLKMVLAGFNYDDPFVRYHPEDEAEEMEFTEADFLARFGSYENATVFLVPANDKKESFVK